VFHTIGAPQSWPTSTIGFIGECGGDRSDVARELLQRVSLDLGRDRAAAVPMHVARGNLIPTATGSTTAKRCM